MPLALVANVGFCVLCISKSWYLNNCSRLTVTSCSKRVLRWASHPLGLRTPFKCPGALLQDNDPSPYPLCSGLHFSEARDYQSSSKNLFGEGRSDFLLRPDCNYFFVVYFSNYCGSCSMHFSCLSVGTDCLLSWPLLQYQPIHDLVKLPKHLDRRHDASIALPCILKLQSSKRVKVGLMITFARGSV